MLAHAAALRRPNGRLQACDGCRRRKVSCDHTQPSCLRCRKSRKTCVYTVSNSTSVLSLPDDQPASPRSAGSPPASITAVHNVTPVSTPRIPSTGQRLRLGKTGYLGATNHSAVLQETRDNLSLLGEALQADDIDEQVYIPNSRKVLSPSMREVCLTLLKFLPLRENTSFRQPRDSYVFRSYMDRIAEHIRESIYATWDEHLMQGRLDDAKLEQMAQSLCFNTSKPLSNYIGDPKAWMDQFTGPSLRWESLGILFEHLNYSAEQNSAQTQSDDVEFMKNYASTSLRCVALCIQLAREFSDGNILLIYLYYRRATLESLMSGDGSLATFENHASVISLLTFHGYHDVPDEPLYQPTLASECQRRLAVSAYATDKATATCTGMPPLLNRRYISTPLPLDISDDDLFADQDVLAQAARDKLDANGWDARGNLHPATFVRARAMLAYIRDEIIELALRRNHTVLPGRIKELRAKHEKVVSQLPQVVTFQLEELQTPKPEIQYNHLYQRLLRRLEILMNEFLMARLLSRQNQDDGELLVISYEMATTTVSVWTHMDVFGHRRNFDWMIIEYGAPAGGVLCLELLKPTFQGSHARNPQIRRSSIVQTLSMLLGFFEWISPSAPNAALCDNCKKIIKRVLATTLDGPAPGQAAADVSDWRFSSQIEFNFDLLDTFDWLRTEV